MYLRCLQLAVVSSVVISAVFYSLRFQAVHLFSRDPTLVTAIMGVMPLLVALQPLDAVSILCESALLAGEQRAYMARASLTGMSVAVGLMYAFQITGTSSLFTIWIALRAYVVGKLLTTFSRVFISSKSPFIAMRKKRLVQELQEQEGD